MPTKFVDFSKLKQEADIERVIIDMLGISDLKGKGHQLRGPCPIHGSESDRTLVVTPNKGLWHCFGGCGGGDVIAFVSKYRDISAKEAAQEIHEWLHGPEVQKEQHKTEKRPQKPAEPDKGMKPLDYLQPEHEAVQALGVETETADAFGAGHAPKGIMRGRFAIPVYDRQGTLVAYCGRAEKGESPTLQFPNGFKPEDYVFNAHAVQEGELYLVRDPLDVLLAYQNGIENVIAPLTEAMSAQQLEMIAALMDECGCETIELF